MDGGQGLHVFWPNGGGEGLLFSLQLKCQHLRIFTLSNSNIKGVYSLIINCERALILPNNLIAGGLISTTVFRSSFAKFHPMEGVANSHIFLLHQHLLQGTRVPDTGPDFLTFWPEALVLAYTHVYISRLHSCRISY